MNKSTILKVSYELSWLNVQTTTMLKSLSCTGRTTGKAHRPAVPLQHST